MKVKLTILLLLALIILLLLYSFLPSIPLKGKLSLQCNAAVGMESGLIEISIKAQNIEGHSIKFFAQQYSDWMNVGDLIVKDAIGKELDVNQNSVTVIGDDFEHQIYSYEIDLSSAVQPLTISYSVQPGTYGRHGHRGYLDKNFGLVSAGQLFLLPKTKQDAEIRISFNVPGDWQVITPWQKKEGFYAPELLSASIEDSMNNTVIAFGQFTQKSRIINDFNVTVFSFSRWPEEHKQLISENAFKLFSYQSSLFGAKHESSFFAVFAPFAEDGGKIFGALWSNGLGFEMPYSTERNWELYSHRIHHVFNSYEPFGMKEEGKSRWFTEATASYYEIKSLSSLGFYDFNAGMKELYQQFKAEQSLFSGSILSEDYNKHYSELEFLHYRKAPIVAFLLNKEINLDEFMKFLYKKYGGTGNSFNVKKELGEFSGKSFDEFFSKYVDGKEEIKIKEFE
ncbi:MAG: hypothetical protein AB1467_03850 [Candidatus Diapherotrites archaeon]